MIVAIVQARFSSRRLPGKVLMPILGRPMLALQIERILRAITVDSVSVATSTDPSDDAVAKAAQAAGARVFRGALEDVLDRFYRAAAQARPLHVVRLTGDCPLVDPRLIDRIVGEHQRTLSHYTSNAVERTYPDGLDVEVMSFPALHRAWREARLPSEREHVTPYLYRHPELFHLHAVKHSEDLSALRWTVDHAVDFELVARIFERLYPSKPDFGFEDVLAMHSSEPALFEPNRAIPADEGWRRSLAEDAAFLNSEKKP